MEQIPDAPWIEETMRTGYCSHSFWNNPPREDDEPEEPFAVYDPDDYRGSNRYGG